MMKAGAREYITHETGGCGVLEVSAPQSLVYVVYETSKRAEG